MVQFILDMKHSTIVYGDKFKTFGQLPQTMSSQGYLIYSARTYLKYEYQTPWDVFYLVAIGSKLGFDEYPGTRYLPKFQICRINQIPFGHGGRGRLVRCRVSLTEDIYVTITVITHIIEWNSTSYSGLWNQRAGWIVWSLASLWKIYQS